MFVFLILSLSGSLGDVGHQVLLPFCKSSQDLEQPQRVWCVALDSPSMILSYLEALANLISCTQLNLLNLRLNRAKFSEALANLLTSLKNDHAEPS